MRKIELRENEKILAEGRISYMIDIIFFDVSYVSGYYYITNQRVSYRDNRFIKDPIDIDIELQTIERYKKTLYIFFPFGIMIQTKEGEIYDFVCFKRNKFIAVLDNLLG